VRNLLFDLDVDVDSLAGVLRLVFPYSALLAPTGFGIPLGNTLRRKSRAKLGVSSTSARLGRFRIAARALARRT